MPYAVDLLLWDHKIYVFNQNALRTVLLEKYYQ